MNYFYHNFNNSEHKLTKEEIDHAIAGINNIAFSFLYKDELSLFIQNNQKALINFKEKNIHPLEADQILHLIESNFVQHLDSDLLVSDISRHKLCDAFGQQLGFVQDIIKKLPVSLLEVSYPVLCLNKSSSITVHQYKYFKSFYPFLINNILKGDSITDEDTWLSFLIKANFNDLKFTQYLIQNITREAGLEDYPETSWKYWSGIIKFMHNPKWHF